jgi:hypothetical protein
MQDPAGGALDGLTTAERERLEREWDEAERDRAALIEAWKERYRQEGKDPEAVRRDGDAVFAERDEG